MKHLESVSGELTATKGADSSVEISGRGQKHANGERKSYTEIVSVCPNADEKVPRQRQLGRTGHDPPRSSGPTVPAGRSTEPR